MNLGFREGRRSGFVFRFSVAQVRTHAPPACPPFFDGRDAAEGQVRVCLNETAVVRAPFLIQNVVEKNSSCVSSARMAVPLTHPPSTHPPRVAYIRTGMYSLGKHVNTLFFVESQSADYAEERKDGRPTKQNRSVKTKLFNKDPKTPRTKIVYRYHYFV